jgi:hypothetical protein
LGDRTSTHCDPPSSASFSGELFTKVTGVEADTTELSERETWTDTGWARRRAFAAKYVKGPVPTCSPATAAMEEDTSVATGNGPS